MLIELRMTFFEMGLQLTDFPIVFLAAIYGALKFLSLKVFILLLNLEDIGNNVKFFILLHIL
jgi:hypothetical protein